MDLLQFEIGRRRGDHRGIHVAGACREAEGGRREQPGVRGEREDQRSGVRQRRDHLPAAEASGRAAAAAGAGAGGARGAAGAEREPDRSPLHEGLAPAR